ncbi:MAG: hypothetical protein A4S09_04580 [Proteobacteria bacterium SG_bin7]|nr:MAG: hypothetical protein A4S09_04580 [Proteobacteria bacterium SG_bin7]
MKRTLISLIASAAVAVSLSANAHEGHGLPGPSAGEIIQTGVNVVVNVGDLVVSFGQTALVRFPKSAAETAKNLAKCIHDGIHANTAGQVVTTPVLCPVTIGTEAATAIVLTGLAGAQAVVAVPSKFAKEIAAIFLKSSKEAWDALANYNQNPIFWLLNLGVCVTNHVIGRAAQLGAAVIDLVSTTVGAVVELAVAGVRTGIKYASDAVIMVADCVTTKVKFLGKELYGLGKGVLVSAVKAGHLDVKGAAQYFMDNVVARLVTLPIRIITGEALGTVIAGSYPKYEDARGPISTY